MILFLDAAKVKKIFETTSVAKMLITLFNIA
jgi:hypothetical protein